MNYVDFAMRSATEAIALFVLVSCVCRIGQMRRTQHKPVWRWSFYLLLVWSAGTVVAVTEAGRADIWQFAGMLGIAMQLWTTRNRWADGPPKMTQRDMPDNSARFSRGEA